MSDPMFIILDHWDGVASQKVILNIGHISRVIGSNSGSTVSCLGTGDLGVFVEQSASEVEKLIREAFEIKARSNQ